MKLIIIENLGSAYFLENGELMQAPLGKYGDIDTTESACVDGSLDAELLETSVDLPNVRFGLNVRNTWGDLRKALIEELS